MTELKNNPQTTWDVIIAGGGPAGLSAALILGRACRRVLVCNDHRPRNAASKGIHGYLTRDGIPPAKFEQIARKQLKPYKVDFQDVKVEKITHKNYFFEALLSNRKKVRGKKLILATGVIDNLPPFLGIESFFGKSVFHCPYCDGWENRNKSIAVYGKGKKGPSMALTMTRWSKNITLCTSGEKISPRNLSVLKKYKIKIRKEKIVRLEGKNGKLKQIIFESGLPLKASCLFFNTDKKPHSELGKFLGCQTQGENMPTDNFQKTKVKGVFVAGDAGGDLNMVILAAAEGAKAAFAINTELMDEEIKEDIA